MEERLHEKCRNPGELQLVHILVSLLVPSCLLGETPVSRILVLSVMLFMLVSCEPHQIPETWRGALTKAGVESMSGQGPYNLEQL